MSGLKDIVADAIDASMEMPEQYGSRPLWRYHQVQWLIGIVAVPILIGLNFFNPKDRLGTILWVAGLLIIGIAVIYFIWRDRIVQKRVDTTGSSLVGREPY